MLRSFSVIVVDKQLHAEFQSGGWCDLEVLPGQANLRDIALRSGLAHNLGGNAGMGIASCVVLGNEK